MTPAARDGRLGAILVNHNFYPMVMETLRMLQEATRRYDDLVVVDNSSGGEFWRLIREELGAAATVVHVENHGYAAAVNTGVRVLAGLGYGPGDYVVVTTHETKPRQDAVGRLVEALEDDLRIGVAGPTLLDGNRSGARIWSEGGRLSRFLGLPEHVNWGRPFTGSQALAPVDRDWVDGAFAAYRWQALADVPLPDVYFMYFEETECHTRLRKAGWRVVWAPQAVVVQASTGIPGYFLGRNVHLFQWRVGTWRGKAFADAWVAGKLLARVFALRTRPCAVPQHVRGLIDGVRSRRADTAIVFPEAVHTRCH